MARLPRIDIPGWPVHLVVRGNDRQDIFRSEGDRIYFHRCLVERVKRHDVSVHAYVLMTNHVHLLATSTAPGALARVIQSMGRRYVSYFNYLYGRTGTLWEGRYRSSIVEADRYLLACHRYIEMNPVRAGIVAVPGDYRWSSHRCNAWGRPDDLVTPHPLYLSLGPDESARHEGYRGLFECAPDGSELEAIRAAMNKGWALGGSSFRQQVEGVTGRRSAPAPRGRPRATRRINLIGV
jgi:putative transposase